MIAPFATLILLGKIWALMYALTILCIGLGVLVVVRPSKRRNLKIDD